MKTQYKKINKVVIAGGGTAGWMAAAAFAKLIGKNLEIVLVESDDIPTVGVGEATIPTLHIFHQLLGISEQEFMAATNATFKLGISFENWRDVKKDYLHSFGFLGQGCWAAGFQHFWLKGRERGIASDIGDYVPEHLGAREGKFAVLAGQDLNHAYHLDAGLYAKFLRKIAEKNHAKRVEGKIDKVNLNDKSGFIDSLTLASGQVVEGDLFIDCTGFKGLLIEEALHTGYDDWSHVLPCDSAIAVQTKTVGRPVPYTRAIAHDAGWQWRIPLQNRTGNGFVFCSKYMSDDEAKKTLLANIEGERLNEPRVIKFKTGQRRKHWVKNCVAMGLSSGFIEPLESTGIHLFQRAIVRLLLMFPSQGIKQSDIDEYNVQTKEEAEHIRDFIILHYNLTERKDTPFWRHCSSMEVPESLKHRMTLFKDSGQVFKKADELFGETSWIQVMMGQGLMPEQYHPIVDMMGDDELRDFLNNIKSGVKRKVQNWPDSNDFIKHYCPSSVNT
ncbi:tryptophan halogenase [Paraglaciecola psychrophila 170]|uniref:Tryptophan halogenase n=2 Tax=Paraglaciecola TaxID=1621534 RepID=K7ABT9_9ALTE|nr:tryptophan halogenase family protein [Paraglaciecola psychrophila]AGH45499.1 tryptophan halogenase [Paraglaciecola psychrophila 170]GAC38163.1 FADH2 O2-dependent halogenase I [Paraglaciecola psychrophila 170]